MVLGLSAGHDLKTMYCTRILFRDEKPTTGCSLNIVFFPENVVIFLDSASSAAALVFYLPGVCTHTDTERKQSPEYLKSLKKTQYLHPVYEVFA